MSSIISLPAEQLFQITSYCSLSDLKALSKTNHHLRNECGMVKLNELYNLALEQFRGLQANFEFKSCWSRELDSNQMINIYVVTLQNFHYSIKKNIEIEIMPDGSPNPFIAIDTYFSLCEPSDGSFSLRESLDPLASTLSPNQLVAAIRLGEGIATHIEIPEDTNFIQKLFYEYLNTNNENFKCDIKYPIKEIKIAYSRKSNFLENDVLVIQKAASHAVKIKKPLYSSNSNIDIGFLKKLL